MLQSSILSPYLHGLGTLANQYDCCRSHYYNNVRNTNFHPPYLKRAVTL
jgi:hypothetical protein